MATRILVLKRYQGNSEPDDRAWWGVGTSFLQIGYTVYQDNERISVEIGDDDEIEEHPTCVHCGHQPDPNK